MRDEMVRKGKVQAHWSANGSRILKYSIEVYHSGLNEHKLISAPELAMVETKATLQIVKWDEKWSQVQSRQETLQKRASDAREAERLTREACHCIQELENILLSTLSVNDAISWDSLKARAEFAEPRPAEPIPPAARNAPPKPERAWPQFAARYSLIERILPHLRKKKNRQKEREFQATIARWDMERTEVEQLNRVEQEKYGAALDEWKNRCTSWEARKTAFCREQHAYNTRIDELRERYTQLDPNAVEQCFEMVLENSRYPDYFAKDFELLYNPETRILICEYYLPEPGAIPRVKEVKFISSKGELRESCLTEPQARKLYDSLVYQIILRTIHELFEADSANAIDAVSINGRVRFISKATGQPEEACIVSLQVKKDAFVGIDLKHVDPKTCFKALKGIGSSTLYGTTAVKPILQIDKSDRRFVTPHAVADGLDDSTNIAAIDWEEFEHLVREVFEKEFNQNGGEVKITRASRDGGVDAVAFDPDPIRGGKIVIQAKRYTNTVGVSAVRDLYGTVLNEGATKGILITTADYGPDAYEFAKNKPLTLLTGGNLLHLLEKHGYKGRIDLKEAKETRDALRENP